MMTDFSCWMRGYARRGYPNDLLVLLPTWRRLIASLDLLSMSQETYLMGRHVPMAIIDHDADTRIHSRRTGSLVIRPGLWGETRTHGPGSWASYFGDGRDKTSVSVPSSQP